MDYQSLYDSLIIFGVVAFLGFLLITLIMAGMGANIQALRNEVNVLKHELKQLKEKL